MFAYKKKIGNEGSERIGFGAGYYMDIAKTDQVNLGELYVPARSTAGYDGGHDEADEVFFIKKGTAVIEFPESGEKETVEEGHYIFMSRGKAHVVHNDGDTEMALIFFGINESFAKSTSKQ
jgi:mannose-6-phosphate isomerase-like protein (cupin superfamily)